MPRGKRSQNKTGAGTFAHVIRAYLNSPKFDALAKSTRENYALPLKLAESTLGAIEVHVIRPALIQGFLDGYEGRPAAQKCAQTSLKALEKWAIVRDLLPQHITTGTQAPGSTGGHLPWTDVQVELAEQHARAHLARIITLAANTGQRGSDLVKMRWSDLEEYEGRLGINVTQIKTAKVLWVPFTAQLAAAVATWERRPGYLALKEDGMPWERTHLSDQWLRERNTRPALSPLKEAGCVLHGLRGTACVRLLRAGAHTRQIADMVGMSEMMVKRYTRFSEQRKNALAAVHYLDRTKPDSGTLKARTKP